MAQWLPDAEEGQPKQQRFERYRIGLFHIGIAELQAAEASLINFS